MLEKYEINTTSRLQHFFAQVAHESKYGKYTREGEYLLDEPHNWTQEEYEAYYNAKSNYRYIDRGAGFIQTTFKYQHKYFATEVIKEKYPQYDIGVIPYSNPVVIDPVYDKMVKVAKENNLDIKEITDISDLGTDYIVSKYSWEITGWW